MGSIFSSRADKSAKIIQHSHDIFSQVQPSTHKLSRVSQLLSQPIATLYKQKSAPELSKLASHAWDGAGVPQDQEKAVSLWAAAAAKGDADAAYAIAQAWEQGVGVPERNPAAARELLEGILAETPHPWSAFMLSTMLLQDTASTTDDKARAAQLLRIAVDGQVPPAAFNLANCYFTGVGVTEPDAAQGLIWLRRAAEMGDPVAAYNLAKRLWAGTDVPRQPRRALQLYQLAAENGYVPAMHNLGVLLAPPTLEEDKSPIPDADGAQYNFSQAVSWFSAAAERHFAPAAVNLSTLLTGRTPDPAPEQVQQAYQTLLACAQAGADGTSPDSGSAEPSERDISLQLEMRRLEEQFPSLLPAAVAGSDAAGNHSSMPGNTEWVPQTATLEVLNKRGVAQPVYITLQTPEAAALVTQALQATGDTELSVQQVKALLEPLRVSQDIEVRE